MDNKTPPLPVQVNPPLGSLFLAFLRLGLTAFGGPAMVTYIRELAVTRKKWISQERFQDGVALCQSIPGATAMQVAAYTGLRARGVRGALVTYTGFGLPAFILMVTLSAIYRTLHDIPAAVSVFGGLRVIVVALVANATINFGRSTIKGWRDLLLLAGLAVYLSLHGTPVISIIAGALLALALYRDVDVQTRSGRRLPPTRIWRAMRPAAAVALLVAAGVATLWWMDDRLCDLATLMIKVDMFAFGGGYASVPLMLDEIVGHRHWLDSRTFMDGIALGQVTPGPIVITATFVGFQIAGLLGAVVATIAVFSPSFIFLLATVPHFDRFQHSALFQQAVRGALVSFVALLLAVAVRFSLAIAWTPAAVVIVVLAFAALRFKIDILWVVLAGSAISAVALR